jgi:predicted tellurium resistance membrane protein TerC
VLGFLSDPEIWVAFLTLTALELVLGVDNIVFITILVDRLPRRERRLGRIVGLALAMVMRIALLFVASWIVGLTAPLFTVTRWALSGRDLVLIGGGLFLVWKSTKEIHESLEGKGEHASRRERGTFAGVIVQIMLIDAVFSLDSIITAVGMVDEIEVIVAAVVVSVALMIVFAGAIGAFVSEHPTVKMLALSFLFVIGVVLIADGFHHHVPKGYIYFSLAFAVGVELLNLRVRRKRPRARH